MKMTKQEMIVKLKLITPLLDEISLKLADTFEPDKNDSWSAADKCQEAAVALAHAIFKLDGSLPSVRNISQNGLWQLQIRERETSEHWHNAGEPFSSIDEAFDKAWSLAGNDSYERI
jgi:hypothetical protein